MRGKRARRQKEKQTKNISWSAPEVPEAYNELSKNIDELYGRLAEAWGHCDDVRFRWVQVAGRRAFIVWIYTLIGKELAQEGLLEPLTTSDGPGASFDDLQRALRTVSV